MTVTSEECKISYVGNGKTKEFSVPFKFFDKELSVMVNGVKGSGYAILQDSSLEGSIYFTEAPLNGTKIVISRDIPLTQNTRFIEGEDFPAEDYENSLDRIYMALQENKNLTEEKLNGYTKEEVDGLLENKADSSDVYTKNEVNDLINSGTFTRMGGGASFPPDDWGGDTTIEGYNYSAIFGSHFTLDTSKEYTVSGVVTLSAKDATSGNIAPVASFNVSNGRIRVTLFAKEKPKENVSVKSTVYFIEEI